MMTYRECPVCHISHGVRNDGRLRMHNTPNPLNPSKRLKRACEGSYTLQELKISTDGSLIPEFSSAEPEQPLPEKTTIIGARGGVKLVIRWEQESYEILSILSPNNSALAEMIVKHVHEPLCLKIGNLIYTIFPGTQRPG